MTDPFLANAMAQMEALKNASTSTYGPTGGSFNRVIMADVSSSMSGEKFDCMKKALKDNVTPDDGIVCFGDDVYALAYQDLNLVRLGGGLTAMLPGMKEAMKMMPTNIVMITDGEPNKGGFPTDVLDFAGSLIGVRIDTIGVSESDCDWSFDPDFLTTLAEITGGSYQHVSDPRKLSSAVMMLTDTAGKGAIQL